MTLSILIAETILFLLVLLFIMVGFLFIFDGLERKDFQSFLAGIGCILAAIFLGYPMQLLGAYL